MTSGAYPASVSVLSPGELFGGVETQIVGLCTCLRDRGIEVLPLLFHDRELAARLRAENLKPVIIAGRHPYDPRAAQELAQVVMEHQSQVLHIHGYRAAVTAALAGSRLDVAVVKTEHGLPEPSESVLSRTKSRLYHALDDWATRQLTASVCYVTNDVMQHCNRAHAGLNRRVVRNGIAPLVRTGRPGPPDLEPGFFHAGIVGRVSKIKGISFALRALASGAVSEAIRLDIIGSGPQLSSLRKEAEALGVGGRVRFHGFQRNVLDWLAHLDVLLMPSLHEGLPYSLLEAMSLGVPVVASRVGGLAEVLSHEKTSLLIDVGDVNGLARALARLEGNPELAHRLGAAAAAEQRRNYALERMVDEYVTVYDEVTSRYRRLSRS